MPRPRQYADPLNDLPPVPTELVEYLEEQYPGHLPRDLSEVDALKIAYAMGARDVVTGLRNLHTAQRRKDDDV